MAKPSWHNRIVGTGEESPDQLLANPRNFRIHPKNQQDALEGVLNEVGWVDDVIVNRTTGHIIDGHLRVSLALRRDEMVPVKYVELTEAEEALVLATFDPISALAGQDDALLRDLMMDVQTDNEAILQMLNDLLGDDPTLTEGLTDPDDVPDPPAEPITKPGDLWTLGRHRLLCGDSRDFSHVDRLFDGARANVVITSPPYASQRKYDPSSGFKPIHPDDYVEWFSVLAANVMAVLADDGSYFLNIKEHCDDGQRHLYVKDLTIAHVRQWGWMFVDEFCWRDTKNGVPGGWPNRFKDAWEPVFHFARQSAIKFYPIANGTDSDAVFEYSADTAKTKTGSGLLGVKATKERSGQARPSNVLEIAAASTGGHSAAYPVELPAWFIRAFSDHDDVIYDPFMGSGTTLMASEQNGRVGFGMELSPAYCDVIVQRWENFTGEHATREPALHEAVA